MTFKGSVMWGTRHIFKQAVVAVAAASCFLAAPASASAGGIESTEQCVGIAVLNWNPTSIESTDAFYNRMRTCQSAFVAHFMDTQKRVEWQKCILYGISRSVPPLGWEPALYAASSCTEKWLDFRIRIDPSPSVRAAKRPAHRRRATRSQLRLTRS